MIGRSKELEDVGRVASSFPTYLGKIEATLLAGYGPSGCGKTNTLLNMLFIFFTLTRFTYIQKILSNQNTKVSFRH